MRTFNIFQFLTFVFFLSLSSCSNDLKDVMYVSAYEKVLYLNSYGEKNIDLYKVSETTEISISVIKTGNNPQATATAEVRILTQSELDYFNSQSGTNYAIMPTSTYQLENAVLNFESADRYFFSKLIFKTAAIEDFLNQTAGEEKEYVIPLGLFSEKDSVNAERDLCIYKPSVKTPSLIFEAESPLSFKMPKQGGVIELPLSLVISENVWDFEVEFEIDKESLTNPEELMPEDAYTLSGEGSVSFTKGSLSDTLKINVHKLNTTYGVIPIKIKGISMDGITLDTRTMLINIELSYPLTIGELYTNALEPSEGKLENILDGDINTFFHSAWSVAIAEKHYVQLNLKESLTALAFTYTNRSANGNAALNDFDVSISTDGVNFELVKNYTKDKDNLPMGGAGVFKSELLTFGKPVKHIRITCNASGTDDNKFFVWSEFGIYDYETSSK